ncbi:MAG: hypothetical protein E7646_09325 [Ruminococcaceae bacterium]|nr:hypothetical protein [Oscillospiraceae bacterium]
MKYIETYENFHQELPSMTKFGSYESGDNRFVYHETAYLHNKTGELWLMVTKNGMGGGGVFYERYDENQEIKEILQRCK